ncbi:MAG TPA: response regulator [Chitinispirillaceae bacterium]|jgi:DNA-binding response OmpR family regulator|nr:response regulator [Chitinispirillaceae bacterium]
MKSYKIIVIDDDPGILEVLEFNLKIRGYNVLSYISGKEALEKVFDEKPDLIILDVIMPDLDGWEMLKIIKDHPAGNAFKILMLTAKSTERDKLIGKSILKADDYVTKPFDLNELLHIIRKLLGDTDDEIEKS